MRQRTGINRHKTAHDNQRRIAPLHACAASCPSVGLAGRTRQRASEWQENGLPRPSVRPGPPVFTAPAGLVNNPKATCLVSGLLDWK